jgi:hypothetical protein
MLEVVTAGATYLVDREKTRWKRIPFETAHPGDGLWIDGGFTLGEGWTALLRTLRSSAKRWSNGSLHLERGLCG